MAVCARCQGAKEIVTKEVIANIPFVGPKKLYEVKATCPECKGTGEAQ